MSEPTCTLVFRTWPKPILFLTACWIFVTKRVPPLWMVGRVKVER